MKAAKWFKWEAAHRLPWHEGPCKHLHGHSYRMRVEVEGTPDERGMLIDFQHLKTIIGPLVDAWDHSTLIGQDDRVLYDACQMIGSKHYVFPYDTTSENLCRYVGEFLQDQATDMLADLGVRSVTIRLQETETCYAETTVDIAPFEPGAGFDAGEAFPLEANEDQPGGYDEGSYSEGSYATSPSEAPAPADPAWKR
jgi:6-pyruvoyltetrahydropterin/6-carboxytetrahydropterin synthase